MGHDEWKQAYLDLLDATMRLGYPEEFAQVMAHELGSPQAIGRMAAYLRYERPTSPEQIADELLAITAMRERWAEQKRSEQANAALTAFYNRPKDE